MSRTLNATLAAVCLMVAGMARGQEPSERPFGEGWRRVVPVPMPALGEGDRYVVWVERGWLQVRRETSKGVTDWHIVLARATGAEPPVIEAKSGTVRFALSYRDRRYFVREDADVLSCLRESKRGIEGEWPAVDVSASTPERPPMLRGWLGDEGFLIASSAGPTEEQRDCLVRLSPRVKENGYAYTAMAGPQRRASWGKNWLSDDGELLVARRTLEAMLELEIGDPAPPLVAMTIDGKPVNLEDYRGKYVLLDFWATWCAPCLEEIPHLKEVHQTFGKDERLVMIGLSLDEEIGAPRKLVAAREIPWAQVHLGGATESPVARAYGAQSIPAIYIIGPNGKVFAKGLRGDQIKGVVAKALGKN